MKSKSGTKAQFRELLHEASVNFELSDRFYRDIVLSMNGAKGRTVRILRDSDHLFSSETDH